MMIITPIRKMRVFCGKFSLTLLKCSSQDASWSMFNAYSLHLRFLNGTAAVSRSSASHDAPADAAVRTDLSRPAPDLQDSADVGAIAGEIRKELGKSTSNELLRQLAQYHFDGEGKAVRPLLCCLVARAVNSHTLSTHSQQVSSDQWRVAMICEMIHTASLVHDDVIDAASLRRGKPSLASRWGEKRAVMTGNFILAVSSTMLARLRNDDVTVILSQVVSDLVQGEFMQLGSRESENDRFAHYLTKTFKKTASLMAHSCKAVALLGGADAALQEAMFQYGRHVGVAFQLVDDLLDFSATSRQLGKPVAVDLQLGLATAPVLFACQQFPELNSLVMRRFKGEGDVARAMACVAKSDALRQTRLLAATHCSAAVSQLDSCQLAESPSRQQLVLLTQSLLTRVK